MQRILVGYTGGTNGSAAIRALADRYGAEIVTLTIDIGQSRELTSIRQRALVSGAVRAHVIDGRAEFATAHAWPAVQAGVRHTERLAGPLLWPLLAAKLIEVARIERVDAIAHGLTGRDAEVFERIVNQLDPALVIVRAADTLAGTTPSAEPNLWIRPTAPEDLQAAEGRRSDYPSTAASLEIEFAAGVPVRLNGIDMPLIELIESLETIAGVHGVGRRQPVDPVLTVDAPAAFVLEEAYAACARAIFDADALDLQAGAASAYERLLVRGHWGRPQHEGVAAFVAALQPYVTGMVRMSLDQATARVVSVRAGEAVPAQAPLEAR